MSSDGLEERDFKIKLNAALLAIPTLNDWIDPEYVLIREDDSSLRDVKFPRACLVISGFSTIDESHMFGISGQMTFYCTINVLVRNSEALNEPLPGASVGLGSGPSLPLIDGALRNAFHLFTFSTWCLDTNLGPGVPIEAEKLPDDAIGRSYSFMALKEVQR